MPVRIRLQRHGKKGKPFYWIVAADGRAKRDGRYLEKIGTYNPNTNPASVELDINQAVKWLENGAQPSDTARTLLSYRGAMMKHHLNGGVKKGAFSQEEADKRFAAWLEEKQDKIQAKIDGLDKDQANDLAQRIEAEKAVNQKRIADLTAAPEAEEVPDGETNDTAETSNEETASAETEAPQQEVASEEVAEEAPAIEEPKAEDVPEGETANAAETSTEETVTAEMETPPEEIAEESPAEEEPKAEEAPAEKVEEETATEEPKAEEVPTEEAKSQDGPAEEEEETKE
jgi:small subunit ribosomal protein S16